MSADDRIHRRERPNRGAAAAARFALALCLAGSALGCREDPAPPRNFVLISLDTLVPDRMSAYGAVRATTPAIDALARRGVRFSHAFSPSPWTLPAHAALLTGRYPSRLVPETADRRILRVAPTLALLFRQAGYRTLAVTGGGFLGRRFGANRGFDRFAERDRWHDLDWDGADRAIAWLEDVGDAPFFLFFHTYVVHVPYTDRRFAQGMEGGRLAELYDMTASGMRRHTDVCCRPIDLTDDERAFLLALYDGGVAAADEMVGELVAALERLGLLPHTAIAVTSDHGEEFWQHTGRAAYHGHTLYDELLRIPLVWFEPGLPDPGRVQTELVSLLDVVPTAVARFGLRGPPSLDGRDLTPLLRGEGDTDRGSGWPSDRTLFADSVKEGPERFSARTQDGKLIETPDRDTQRGEGVRYPVPVLAPRELYLAADSAETSNRMGEQPELSKTLAQRLAGHRAAASKSQPPMPLEPLDAQTRANLEALGYAQ